MPKAFLLAALLAGAVLLASVPAARAAAGPCIADYPHDAQCTVWTGKVRWVDDGDTLDANVSGDGRGPLRVRLIGVNATELTSYRAAGRAGECHAVDATKRLGQLVRRSKRRIRVSALYPESRSRGRRLRSIAVRYRGRWHDVGRILVAEGLALWLPGGSEDAPNLRYSELSQKAAAAHKGLFSPNACGLGPNEGQPLKLWVNWDADGDDHDDVNGEWVKIKNQDPANPLPLDGWYVRDSGLRRFTFPPGSSIGPGQTITVYVGQGESFGSDYFWGLTNPVFQNASRDERASGDGAYLFDPQGDIRASMIYPCRVGCTDPNLGLIGLGAQARGREYVSIRNNTTWAIDLEPYTLKSKPYSYAFPPGSVINPGETMRVYTEGDPADDTALEKHWGLTDPILDNGGDVAALETYTDIRVACTAYGSRSC